MFITCLQVEPNPEIVDKLKTKLHEWFEEAKRMEAVVYPKNSQPIPHTSSKILSDRTSKENNHSDDRPKSPINNLTRSKSKSFDPSVSPS